MTLATQPPGAGRAVAAVALAYALLAFAFPDRGASTWLAALADAAFTAAWVAATGAAHSPFIPLWFLALGGAVATLGRVAVPPVVGIIVVAHFGWADPGEHLVALRQVVGLVLAAGTLYVLAPGGLVGREREKRELAQLREMDAFKTRFLNTAAHELNTPLTPLKLQIHLLKTGAFGGLDARQARSVEVLDRNVERLAALVREVLDVARFQSGNLRLSLRPLRLDDVVAEAVETYKEPARHMGITLTHVPARGTATVDADAQRVTQVLYNLFGNALKFTPEGGRISVHTTVEGDRAVVRVVDTGVGLTSAQIARLFQPFVQVHDTTRTSATGTGLGLFISRGIVEAHGGRIRVESGGAGQGSTFAVDLPLAGAAPAPAPPAPAAAPAPPRDPLAGRMRELI